MTIDATTSDAATSHAATSEVMACPRCRVLASQRFYGPCESCRTQLRALFHGEGRELVVPEYVPKMNVTPNAVALKDD